MTVTVQASDRSRHLVLRAGGGDAVPEAILALLKREGVSCGWLRASGVLAEVELRAYDGELGALGRTRRIAGPVHALAIEGSIGLVDGQPSLSLRALLARESDRGLETIAGEVSSAQAVALEALVTCLDDLSIERALDDRAGVWLLAANSMLPEAAAASRPSPAQAAPAPAAWAVALEASERAEPAKPRAASTGTGTAAMPARPPRPGPGIDLDVRIPERGDIVEHFAFGRCEVLKSDGDRLHVKVPKDGRVREIALEMLRVIPLGDSEAGGHRFKLERRI